MDGVCWHFQQVLFSNKTERIIHACFEVHKQLGCGFLESVYQEALAIELVIENIPFEVEKKLPVFYKGNELKKWFVVDFLCYNNIVLELKAVEFLNNEHFSQVLNYLKATGLKVGLLVKFGSRSVQVKRVVL